MKGASGADDPLPAVKFTVSGAVSGDSWLTTSDRRPSTSTGRSATVGRQHNFDAVGKVRREIGKVVRRAVGAGQHDRRRAKDLRRITLWLEPAIALRDCRAQRRRAHWRWCRRAHPARQDRDGSASPIAATVLPSRRSLTKALTTAFSPAPSGATMMSSKSRVGRVSAGSRRVSMSTTRSARP